MAKTFPKHSEGVFLAVNCAKLLMHLIHYSDITVLADNCIHLIKEVIFKFRFFWFKKPSKYKSRLKLTAVFLKYFSVKSQASAVFVVELLQRDIHICFICLGDI